jgi:hypothetical protein
MTSFPHNRQKSTGVLDRPVPFIHLVRQAEAAVVGLLKSSTGRSEPPAIAA